MTLLIVVNPYAHECEQKYQRCREESDPVDNGNVGDDGDDGHGHVPACRRS